MYHGRGEFCMRLVSYEKNGQRSTGALTINGIIVLPQASGGVLPADMVALLQLGDDGIVQAREGTTRGKTAISLKEARLLAPVPHPGKIIGIGLNYADHAS